MKNSFYLQTNLTLLSQLNPTLYYKLMQAEPDLLQFKQTDKQELNLMREYRGHHYFYHATSGAKEEAEIWFNHLDLSTINVLYIYGIGLGYYYQAAKKWLHEHPQRACVFLEKDLAVLYRLFETEQGHDLLNDPQVQVIYFSNFIDDKAVFNELTWIYLNEPFSLSFLPLYDEQDPTTCSELQQFLSEKIAHKRMLADEYLHYGIPFFKNFYANLLELPHAYLGSGLFNQFRDIPAIICGAGPSLTKQIEQLKHLQDRALIFAGGSALNALTAHGLIPHFGAGVDPNPEQGKRIEQTKAYPVPFFYRNRFYHPALTALKGPRLYLTGAGGYEIADWFDEQLGLSSPPLDEGHNIVNFCLEIAHKLGCNPIIFVGLDLAFTNQQIYAQGVVDDLVLDQSKQASHFEDQLVLRTDITGKPIYTLWRWVIESTWTDQFAQEHLELQLINATEGGIGFKHIQNSSLTATAREYLKKNYPLKKQIKHILKTHSLSSIKIDQIKQLMSILNHSLQTCLNQINILIHEIQKAQQVELDSFESSTTQLAESALEQEIGYQYLLNQFNRFFSCLQLRDKKKLNDPRLGFDAKKKQALIQHLHHQRLQYLKEIIEINRQLFF